MLGGHDAYKHELKS